MTLWIVFNAVVLALLALDLLVFHRTAHEIRFKEAAWWSVFWVALSLAFGVGVYLFRGPEAGLEFFAGYLIEKSLSVDNIFVFVLVFSYFRVPLRYQHRVLFWGILAALIMRGVMIAAGVYLIERFEWITYVFGAVLVITAIRMAMHDSEDIHVEANPVVKLARRFLPISDTYHGQKFFVRGEYKGRERLIATPMLIVLLVIESTDLVFALDSIPAIFAVTRDPFIVYSSNVGAILGLRALYFLLAGVVHKFRWLKFGLSGVLVFVGAKMLLAQVYHVPIGISLGVIAALIGGSIVASLLRPESAATPPEVPEDAPSSKDAPPERQPPKAEGIPPDDEAA